MSYEKLAAKWHAAKDGTQFAKCFYWKKEWYVLTGYFGKHRKLGTVAQYRSATTNKVEWNDPNGSFVYTDDTITGQWHEDVNGVTNKPWGVK